MKVVVITGASSGIGASVAKEAARRGHRLVLVARRNDQLEAVARECRELGSEVVVLVGDLEKSETRAWIVDRTLQSFGQLDVLINNAGFGLPTLFADSEPLAIRSQIEVNLVAPMVLTRLALPSLIETKGTVINIGSAITCVANPALGAYGATKAALAYWSSALRREIGHLGVQICLVEPGPIKTDFFNSLSKRKRAGDSHHPMLDAPYPWMSISVDLAAKRIVSLIEKPKRRLSVPKRFVWPWRLLGVFFQCFPMVGDAGVSNVVRYYDAKIDRGHGHASETSS